PTTTDLFFRQAVGRLVRWTPGERDQRAWLYMPDDARLRTWAAQLASQRRHSLVKPSQEPSEFVQPSELSIPERLEADLEQLSLFPPRSAVAPGVGAGISGAG